LAVPHKAFLSISIKNYLKKQHVIFDVKGALNKNEVDARL
jgi:UDP-N-acetyl-D-mannosaminuronate dehydrogenase